MAMLMTSTRRPETSNGGRRLLRRPQSFIGGAGRRSFVEYPPGDSITGPASPAETITCAIIDRLDAGGDPAAALGVRGGAQGRPPRANGGATRHREHLRLWRLPSNGVAIGHGIGRPTARRRPLAGPCREQAQFAIFYKAYSKKVDASERPGELAMSIAG
jgi:hypothetical protein